MELELPYFTNFGLYVIFSMPYPPNIPFPRSKTASAHLPVCSCGPWQCLSYTLDRCKPILGFLHCHKERAPCEHLPATGLPFQGHSNNNLLWFLAEQVSLRYQLPASKHPPCALLSQPAAQTNCFPSCAMPGWNRGKWECSTYKPDTRVRKALDNAQFQNDHLASMFARHRETPMEIEK